RFDNPQLVAVLRGEQVWLDGLVQEVDFAGGQLTDFEDDHRYVARFTAGLAYRPVPSVAFQLAYEYTMTDSGQSLSGVTNFLTAQEHEDHANTILVGAAFAQEEEEEADPAQVAIGERLFLETRFAQFAAAQGGDVNAPFPIGD